MFLEGAPCQIYGSHGYWPFPLHGKERGYKLNLTRFICHPNFKFKNSQEFKKNNSQKSRMKMMFSAKKYRKTATQLLVVIYLSFQDAVVSGIYYMYMYMLYWEHVIHIRVQGLFQGGQGVLTPPPLSNWLSLSLI